MKYRRLGKTGLKISEFSFGSWVTFGPQIDNKVSIDMIKYAYDNGVNFFDNAEVYSKGESETIMGNAIKSLGFRRGSYLISTKLFWGINDGPNEKNTLNRKYLIEGINGSLKRLQLEYVDLLYCHRPDSYTPLEETVYAMNDIITSGKALYWGTSEWSAEEIRGAYDIALRDGLHRPVVEQPEYNLFNRTKIEKEFARLYDDIGLGTTTWSPLASGLLTGKYNKGIPKDSRGALQGYDWLSDKLTNKNNIEKVVNFSTIANDLGAQPSQLALAWCLKNKNVSSVILGASKMEQLKENLKSVNLVDKLDHGVMDKIEKIFSTEEN